MNRSDLSQALAQSFAHLTHQDAEACVDLILKTLTASLARGGRVEIRGFGSFAVSEREARVGRNPRTGESVAVAPMRMPRFKPGKALREKTNACAKGGSLTWGQE